MAGKSSKGRNKGKSSNSNSTGGPKLVAETEKSLVSSNGDANAVVNLASQPSAVDEAIVGTPEINDAAEEMSKDSKQADGEILLYPVPVKTLSGETLELQLSPGDSVMDVRLFLLDAPETCFFTCYDLILHTKDGSAYPLDDYSEMSGVGDITTGGCSLEMAAAFYDARSIRSHVRRARELWTLSSLHTSSSTFLASLYETTKQKSADVKLEAPVLDSLGFMEDISGSLQNLMTPLRKETNCVESIMFSSFNPPPSHRRLAGDLIYIDVVALEGNKFCITGTTTGFYVNSSIGELLDSRPAKPEHKANTLIGLLQKISPSFKKGFREIMEQKAAAHPLENIQPPLSPNSWLGVYPIPDHIRDDARAEDTLNLSYGTELIGMQRDWNEELQSCREFPRATLQERILRDRALYKVTCDFVDAARNGAIGVINRCIPPINPTDPECFHMYVHNNIFFSFAVDADLEQIFKNVSLNVKSDFGANCCEGAITLSDSSVKDSSTLDGTIGDSSSCISESANTNTIEGAVDLTSNVAIEADITVSEQATYASANNDLKGTKGYQAADVPGLYNLAMAIIDYRGYRVVAQSIIPGILQGDKSDSLLYGSVDNGKKICWNESFHSKVVEAAKRLHLKEHAVLDGSGNVIKLAAPVECKGIVGSDGRQYILDLMRVTPRDANYSGPGSKFFVLRPELVASFCQAEAAERSHCKLKTGREVPVEPVSRNVVGTDLDASVEVHEKANEECVSVSSPSSTSCQDIFLNPNTFTEFKLAGNEEEIAADKACVRKAGSYLIDVVLPKFVLDLGALEVSPMDGQTLTDALHSHGINVRYLGKVANMTRNLPHLWDICTNEIVVRSAKHILKDVMRESQDHDLASAISHFLNCFIGHIESVGIKGSLDCMAEKSKKSHQSSHKHVKGQMRWSYASSSTKSDSTLTIMTSEGLWYHIQEFARFKYQFEVPDGARSQVKKVYVIRNLCQKVGVTIAARKYDLDASEPFQSSDILDLQPVVKHSVPICSEATYLMDAGKVRLAEGILNEAYTLFSEAFAILQQVTGPMHQEVANCCRYLAVILYHAGDMHGAISQLNKELIINERCLGLDHPETAHSYVNMALFYHGLNKTELALRLMSRTLLLLGLSSGPDHPEVATAFINVAMMYQDIGNMNTALRYLQAALKKNEGLLGKEHVQTAGCYHALAIAFNYMGAYKLSVQHEKKTYDILVKLLGEEDSRTRESENWMKSFKLREQQAIAQKQKGQSVSPTSAQKALEILKVLQVRAGNTSTVSTNKSINAALIGETAPRGRRVDERAARAAAEVRKKAAAKGLQVRSSGIPVQSLPPLVQLMNIINSQATGPETLASSKTSESKKTISESPLQNGNAGDPKNADGSAENQC